MGSNLAAHLIYGYVLDGADQWEIEETDEYGYGIKLDWFDNSYDPDSDDDSDDDEPEFTDAATIRLLATVGIAADDYWDGEADLKEHFGISFSWYGGQDQNNCVIGTHEEVADDYGSRVVDVAAIGTPEQCAEWDARLARVIGILGITPKQAKPGWVLCPSYG